jgi:hypothetical protein
LSLGLRSANVNVGNFHAKIIANANRQENFANK